MEIAMFIAGVAAGLAIYRMLSHIMGKNVWTICENCEYRRKRRTPCHQISLPALSQEGEWNGGGGAPEAPHSIPCPPPTPKENEGCLETSLL